MIADRNVLVTGGAGSVGRALVNRILDRDPAVVRILDNNEPGLVGFKADMDDDRCRFLAGDIRDRERLERALDEIDVVIHLAAMKHVDICEYNPFEAVKTNVLGLQNLIDASIDASVDRLVFTSSDKAVNPANTMGTTKLLGERLVTAANKYRGEQDTRLASVRFGNVVNSSQSVIPLFRRQIRSGGPVTLTDSRMTRFFLTYDGVMDLIGGAIEHTKGGEVFIQKMDAISIEDLAEVMIAELAPGYGYDPEQIAVEITGRRIGETYHEEILTERESVRTVENCSLYAVLPESAAEYITHGGLDGFESAEEIPRTSENAETLDKDEISGILRRSMDEEIPG